MLISHRKKFIYTKTVKTAGTSVEVFFERYCMKDGFYSQAHARDEYIGGSGIIGYRGNDPGNAEWKSHMPAGAIKEKIGENIWSRYFKFCVVRNPFDKMVSWFHFVKNTSLLKANSPGLENGENEVERFRNWVKNGGKCIDRDKYLINGEICIDYFVFFEDLEKGIKEVCERLSIPFEPWKIPKLKFGNRINDLSLKDYYDSETVKIVSRIYDFEISKFGYEPP